jgi:glycosyltransferase involved in cell wall biosynthesis
MMMSGPKIDADQAVVVLSYWNLNHPSFGGARRVQALLDMLGARVILCQPAPPHPHLRTWAYHPDLGRKKLGINWGLFNFFVPTTAALVRRELRRQPPALIVATSIWVYAPLCNMKNRPPVVLDAHDVLGNAIEERYGERHWFTRWVRSWERRVVRAVDHVFTCSEFDRRQFIERYGVAEDRVTTVPNGVDMEVWRATASTGDGQGTGIDPTHEAALQGSRVLFFMGKLDYQPNREALKFLAERLMPELQRGGGERFCLLVCGGPAPSSSPHPSILFAGKVPDIVPYVRRADICLAPIFTGSGTRLKILEYMAAGKPVVATPKGAEGIACRDGEHLAMASGDTFAEAIRLLARDPAKAARLGSSGRALVEARHAWSSIQEKWRAGMGPWL